VIGLDNYRTVPIDWSSLQKPDPCIVCFCSKTTLLYPPTFRGTMSDVPRHFLAHRTATARGPIVKCGNCGFVFTSPRFVPSEYDEIYSSIPKPHEGLVEFDAAKAARFERLASIVRQHSQRGAFIDFGCGDGAFLQRMDDPAGKGFEIGPPGHRAAGRSEIITGDWATFAESSDAPSHALEFITAFDVLEHLPRIGQDVGIIRSMLKPGGLLFVTVPNVESWAARLMGERWNMLLLEHLWYFSPTTLTAFLSKHRFAEVQLRSLPYDAPLAHIINRTGQSFGMRFSQVPKGITRMVLPVPAGILLGIYQAN
jgi:hypothetical protein